MDTLYHEAASQMLNARKAVILTGAGFSTPSGIPDFRSRGSGLWEKHDPMEVASLHAFRVNPERFYRWLRPLAGLILSAVPNPAHHALVQLERIGVLRAVITQNIDGLHQAAGSETVFEIHGSLTWLICASCLRRYPSARFITAFLESGTLPRCLECRTVLKPEAILFGEQLPWETWRMVEKNIQNCDLMLVAGTSLTVMPTARLPFEAVEKGVPIIVINRTATYLDSRAVSVLRGDVAEILPKLVEAVVRVTT